MFRCHRAAHTAGMLIDIRAEHLDPPVGWIITDDGVTRAFRGWLGLLSLLVELLGGEGERATSPDRA